MRLSVCLLFVSFTAAAQTAPVSVRTTGAGEKIVLSRSLEKALHDFDSAFVPLTPDDYIATLRDKGHPSGRGSLVFCVGDFDGNRLDDVVILGRSGGGMRLLIAFQQKKNRFTLMKVKDFPFFEPGEEDAFVSKVPAYTLNVTAEKRTLSFKTDTFLLTYYRRGSILYNWNGREFIQNQMVQ